MSRQSFNFAVLNLGCTKNLVEAQHLIGHFLSLSSSTISKHKNTIGHDSYKIQYFADPNDIKVRFVFLNTCGFISSGRYEAMSKIKNLLNMNKIVYVFGCAVRYYDIADPKPKNEVVKTKPKEQNENNEETRLRNELMQNPNVNIISRKDIEILSIKSILAKYSNPNIGEFEFVNTTRAYTNLHLGFEYVKIAEGCNNSCSFCIIPKLRGKQKSVKMETIYDEITNIVNMGGEEIILLAQDSTRYGIDIYHQPSLIELLQKIDRLDLNFRYRVLYLYPDILTTNYMYELAKLKKFIPFFDIPLQHINDQILKSMGRFNDKQSILDILTQIRQKFKISYIRTNIIIGFPGETDEIFDELCDFVAKTDINTIAFFEYHDEPLASSYKLPNKIDGKIIRQRFQKIRKVRENNLKKRKNLTNFDFEIEV